MRKDAANKARGFKPGGMVPGPSGQTSARVHAGEEVKLPEHKAREAEGSKDREEERPRD